ncbi:hypothetical protein FIV42_05410 [Persicimonas caeni]|uniref:Uncharacterized protein n=1 Tax=Persicimonas caeni TaxID=2292766 RepID=A0A4Y6PPB5_PERCE|nr:hypothetical protein [Persicimonas caeni]QDG50186.1 hypothetical protein FIV42_05410 [Persicimonas caeni]QED31407.1 hypothetical protein FRD00_05405 [Persicimonas caeni]
MTQEIEFPDVNQGTLDEATLAQYFRDLEHAEVFAVMVKGGPERYANARSLELSVGKQLFDKGLCHGVQVRYLWQGEEWWDTLFRTPREIKLVRIKQEWPDE